MSKLEQLLLKINEVKTLTEQQTDETLSAVLQTNVQNFVKESLYKKDKMVKEDDSDYEEEVVTPTDDDDMYNMDDDMNEPSEDEDEDEMESSEYEDEDEMESSEYEDEDEDEMESSEYEDEDEEILDLTGNDLSVEEVISKIQDALKNLPDDTKVNFEFVKNPPTYDVKSSEDVLESSHKYNFMDEEDDYMDDEDEDYNESEINEWIESALKESVNESLIDEYKSIVEQYEKKLSMMERVHAKELKNLTESLQQSKKQVKKLKEDQNKYNNALTESHQLLEQLAVHNTNLLHITKLFTEQSINKNEKVEIARQFDNVKTINESKILFEALTKTLPKKENQNKEIQSIKEELKSQSKKEIIKEEKTFIDKDFDRFNKLISYKI